jgi:type IV secretory pathway VirB2 component (pilin)
MRHTMNIHPDAQNTNSARLLILAVSIACIAMPSGAYAWQLVLCTLADFAHGNIGRGLATLGVMIVAIGAILGKVSWGLAITVAVGIAGLFNAPAIAVAIVPHASC